MLRSSPFDIGVITNVEADVNRSAERVKSLLIEQAVRPVRWEESVKKLVALSCHRAIEIGPGKSAEGADQAYRAGDASG